MTTLYGVGAMTQTQTVQLPSLHSELLHFSAFCIKGPDKSCKQDWLHNLWDPVQSENAWLWLVVRS